MSIETATAVLMWHGMFLFLLGLLKGLVEQHFTNPGWTGRPSGRRHERDFSRRRLGAIWAEVRLFAPLKPGVHGARCTALRQLGRHHAGGNIGAQSLSPITGPRRSALAGDGCERSAS